MPMRIVKRQVLKTKPKRIISIEFVSNSLSIFI